MQQAQKLTAVELDHYGRQIKAHFNAAQKHKDKYFNHLQSAALLLVQAKEQLGHGKFLPWLDKHGINRKTAARWMQEYTDPAKVEQRRQEAREREQAMRDAAKCPTCETFDPEPEAPQSSPATREVDPPEPRKPRAEKAPVLRLQQQRITKLLADLNAEQLAEVEAFVRSLTGA